MAFLITPMDVEGYTYCCDPTSKRTPAVLADDATEVSADKWELFHETAPGDATSNPDAESAQIGLGSVVFGVCCASQIVFEVEGNIETLYDEYDWIEILVDGDVEYYHESTSTSSDPWETVSVGPTTVTVNLDERPCGHLVEISASTDDKVANNDVWWTVRIVSIS